MQKEELRTIRQEELAPDDRNADKYTYQPELTQDLDQYEGDFTRDHFNLMVLWKVNRYVPFTKEAIDSINEIDPRSNERHNEQTSKALNALLRLKGVRLPMASTFLRFRNPNVYQIIDQRVYRFIFGEKLKLPSGKSDSAVDQMITIYNGYLEELDDVCNKKQIPFHLSDRWLYQADLRVNKDIKINY